MEDTLLLVIVRFVAHSDFLFPDLLPQLAVHKRNPTTRRWGLFLKNTSHVMEEPGGAGEEGQSIIHVVQKILGVLIALRCRQREPTGGGISVLGNILPQQG